LRVLKLRFSPFPVVTLAERDSQSPTATTLLSTTMAEAASPAPAEHSSMELMDSAVDGTAPDDAVAAAAAVLAALPEETATASGMSTAGAVHYHHLPPCGLTCLNASWVCALRCAGASKSSEEWTARRDSAGRLLCERCSRQLAKVKGKLHRSGPGHICQKCYNQQRLPRAGKATAAAPALPQPKKRRIVSDPGEPLPLRSRTQAITRRIAHPPPSSAQHKKQRITHLDDKIGQQLKETHARRMAALVAAPSGTAHQ
jgi:hypothetical protein